MEEQDFTLGPFIFAHEQSKRSKLFQFAGHVHPMLQLHSGPDSLRLPSFIVDEKFCLLPAFTHLTGGHTVKLEKGQKAMVLTHDGVEVFEKGR
ncbi:MAG TPA: hypothetical protein VNJ08_13470 [Bacteriovoracaceae bacterium]|nr:hypothetical protein [Bacteriovoracaceae bacterium]